MDASTEMKQRADLRDYLAAERTLLAWIRTGLALMGFGFVVARFALFLQQLQIGQHAPATEPYALSQWFGTALIGASIVVNVLSGWHHVQLVRTMSAGHEETRHSTTLAVSTSLFLALVGLAMTIYLVSIRGPANRQSENTTRASMAQVAQASGTAPLLAESQTAMVKMMAAMDVRSSGGADPDFVAMMTPHHQGAIDMARAELRYGRNEQLRRLAQEIIVTQQQEITAMRLAIGAPLLPSVAPPVPPSSTDTQPSAHKPMRVH